MTDCPKCKEKTKRIRKLLRENRNLRDNLRSYSEEDEERMHPTSEIGRRNKEAIEKAAREDYEEWRSS